jgi:hypothetical protein
MVDQSETFARSLVSLQRAHQKTATGLEYARRHAAEHKLGETWSNNSIPCQRRVSRWSTLRVSSGWFVIDPSAVRSSDAFVLWKRRRCNWSWKQEPCQFVIGAQEQAFPLPSQCFSCAPVCQILTRAGMLRRRFILGRCFKVRLALGPRLQNNMATGFRQS